MGLGKFLKKAVSSVAKRAPLIVGTALGIPGAQAALGSSVQTAFEKSLTRGAGAADVGAGVPNLMPTFMPGGPEIMLPPLPFAMPVRAASFAAQRATNGGLAVPAAGAMPAVAMGMTRAVVGAIVKLAGRLGVVVTATNIGRVGARLWRSVSGLARRYPGVSILTFLTGLGLTLDEAGEFLFWGQTKRRRRRGGGISGRDIRITRRTLRRLGAFRARLGISARRAGSRRSRGRDGAIVVAQQD